MESTKKILGFTDEITECDCCGKADLKGTYAVSLNDFISYFGSVCAFKVHAISYEDQKEIKKTFVKRQKATEKLKQMESEHNGTRYSIDKMLKFIEAKQLDLMSFINKYGKICDENDYYIAYEIGNRVKMINK